MELSVLVDRAVGGANLVDGQIELMLHRFFFLVPALTSKLYLFAFGFFFLPLTDYYDGMQM